MTLCVLMSTYNGEKYVIEQLDSIFAQEFDGELCIYIRDDASTDRTVELIENYSKKHHNIILDRGMNVGPAKSFLCALNNCPEADYYAFCDQDDIWKKDKLSNAIERIGVVDTPVLWASNYEVVDCNRKIIKKTGMDNPCDQHLKVLFYNDIPGCVMVFNQALLFQMRKMKINEIRMHDIMALNIALITGSFIYEKKAFIEYRQHDNNAVGYGHKKIKIIQWIKKKTLLLINKEKYSFGEYAREIINNFSDYLSKKDIEEYRLIEKSRHSLVSRIRLLSKEYTKSKIGRTSISIRLKILFGIF